MIYRLLVMIIVALWCVQTAIGQTASRHEIEAETVLMRYFDALTQGDTATLRSLIGGDLLKKRALLLDNPTYPGHLIAVYQNARFQVHDFTPVNDDSIIVHVSVVLPTGETLNRQFLLTKDADVAGTPLLIHGENQVQ